MRILYATGDRSGSYLQLKRYLPLFQSSSHQWKIAGYKSSLNDLNADYCLDALLDFRNPNNFIQFNGNFSYYARELIKFKPDLIISDLDIYTSLIAINQNIPLWQISPALLHYGLPDFLIRDLRISSYSGKVVDSSKFDRTSDIVRLSQRKLISSHLCDIDNPPNLLEGFEWCHPEFSLDDKTDKYAESSGFAVDLADHFYNERYTIIDYQEADLETTTAVYANIYYELGQFKSKQLDVKKIKVKVNDKIPFLMDLLPK